MPVFYHTDRLGLLSTGDQFHLIKPQPNQPFKWRGGIATGEASLTRWVASEFPEGLSPHGIAYLLMLGGGAIQNGHFESFLEEVRRHRFPERLSRFQAVFGLKSRDDAIAFGEKYGTQTRFRVLRVQADEATEHDMNAISNPVTYGHALPGSMRYWAGEASANPFWEVLMRPPILVEEVVHEHQPPDA